MNVLVDVRRIMWRAKEVAPAGFAFGLHFKAMGPSLVFQAYPPEWLSIYNGQGLALQDPAARYTLAENGACRWSELPEPDPAGVLERARDFGLNFGVSIGLDDGTTHSGAGFARSDREYTDEEIEHLMKVTVRLHRVTAPEANIGEATAKELRELASVMSHPKY